MRSPKSNQETPKNRGRMLPTLRNAGTSGSGLNPAKKGVEAVMAY